MTKIFETDSIQVKFAKYKTLSLCFTHANKTSEHYLLPMEYLSFPTRKQKKEKRENRSVHMHVFASRADYRGKKVMSISIIGTSWR